jgi:hypothetical protein
MIIKYLNKKKKLKYVLNKLNNEINQIELIIYLKLKDFVSSTFKS